jgi:hypothetical protein
VAGGGATFRQGPPLTDTVRLLFQVCFLDGILELIASLLFLAVLGPM